MLTRTTPRSLFAALCTVLAFSCSGSQTHSSSQPTSESSAPPVHSYTDSDVISGVAVAREQVWVGTARGILRYPIAGGTPTRLGVTEGLPDRQIFAISASADGDVWAATPRGVVKYGIDHFAPVGDGQPDVGRPTAILGLAGGAAVLGGAQGIAHFDGTHWSILSNQYQVTALALDQGEPIVATAQSGLLALPADFTRIDEFSPATGIPEALVRSMAGSGNGRYWALLQGADGTKLGYYDGSRWYGYTSEHTRTPWLGVISYHGNAALIAQGGLYEIVGQGGEALTPTDAPNPSGANRVAIAPQVVQAPAPSAAPESAPQTRPHGRGRPGRTGGRRQKEHAASVGQIDAQTAAGAGSSASASPRPANQASAAPAPVTARPPIRPRNIPTYAPPVEATPVTPPLQAPRFGLQRIEGAATSDDNATAWGTSSGVYLWRIGLGVSRIAGGPAVDYRVHDLAMQHRPLSLATDPDDNVWFVTEDGGSARYDGTRFSRVQLDSTGDAWPLMFWSRGTVAAAVARVGPNQVRTYRFNGGHWQAVTERPIDTAGPGIVDVKFLSVDERGRYWLGIRVIEANRTRELGVAVIDENLPAVTQFNSHTPPTGGEQGAVPAPDDLTAVEFDANGVAWFAGLTGATSIALPTEPGGRATVHTYNETTGVQGDVVSDLARGPGDKLYVATPEALGRIDASQFVFDVEGSSAVAHVIALATDGTSALWGAGPHGAWVYNGHMFRPVGRGDGLPIEEFNDIAVDGLNHVWFVTSEGISIMAQHTVTPTTAASSAGGEH